MTFFLYNLLTNHCHRTHEVVSCLCLFRFEYVDILCCPCMYLIMWIKACFVPFTSFDMYFDRTRGAWVISSLSKFMKLILAIALPTQYSFLSPSSGPDRTLSSSSSVSCELAATNWTRPHSASNHFLHACRDLHSSLCYLYTTSICCSSTSFHEHLPSYCS